MSEKNGTNWRLRRAANDIGGGQRASEQVEHAIPSRDAAIALFDDIIAEAPGVADASQIGEWVLVRDAHGRIFKLTVALV